ncbi:SNF1-interacting protein [Actinomortierella ambigua]|nr:SNF1-interacting protein [Actinomortierella ambigua]
MTTVPPNPPSVPDNSTATEGVAALIPVANITLEDALLDNPNFRANIKLFEGQVFFLESWLVALVRRLNEVVAILNKRTEVPLLSQGMLSAQYTLPAMKLASGAFRTMLALKHQYIVEVNERVVKPLEDFVKNDLKEFKESKKVFDKALEKYESALAKYSGQSRQKEPSALREEAFQLYDVRKAYIQAAMSCAMLCIKFQDSLDQLILGVFLDIMATQHDYFSGNADHCGSMALQVLQLKTYMREHKEASGIALRELQQTKDRYTADAIDYWKPTRSLKCYASNAPTQKPSPIGSALLSVAYMTGPTHATPFLSRNTGLSRPPTMESQRGTATTGSSLTSHPSMPNISIEDTSNGSTAVLPHSKSMESLNHLGARANSSSAVVTTNGSNSDRSSTLPLPQSNAPTITEHILCENTCNTTPTTKQGYLNIRIPQPKNRAPVWQRKYFFIQEGEFGFESVVSSPSVGSQVVQSERISVAQCDVRYGSSGSMISPLTSGSSASSLTPSQASSSGGGGSGGGGGLAMVQMERRFCFEVVCATQSYLLQAETEDDLMSWVNTFEAAKREVQEQQRLPKFPDAEEPYSPMPMAESPNSRFSFPLGDNSPGEKNEADNGTQQQDSKVSGALGWAASVPGFSLLLNTYTGNNSTTNGNGTGDAPEVAEETSTSGADVSEKPEDGSDNAQSSATGIATPADVSPSASTTPPPPIPPNYFGSLPPGGGRKSREPLPMLDTSRRAASESKVSTLLNVAEGPAAPTSAGHDSVASTKSFGAHQSSQLEKLMNSAHHLVPKSSPPPAADIPHYTMELVVRNRELHHRFMGTKLHKKEYVLHSWTSGYWDDCRSEPIMVYGRIYLTQSAMYFYSRDLSIETRRMFRFSAMQGIECEQKDILTEWRIETLDGKQHIFSQFSLSDTEYLVMKLIWTNAHSSSSRRPVKDLYKKTLRITSKPKLTAGSGSLAETESTHSTRIEGIVHHGGRSSLTAPLRDSSNNTEEMSQSDDFQDDDDSVPKTVLASKTSDRGMTVLTYPDEVFPASMVQPPGPVDCQCSGHLERVESEVVFKVPAKTLNRLLMDYHSRVRREFHDRRNDTVYEVGNWVIEGGKKTRIVKYLFTINNPMVRLNKTDSIETQTCEVEDEHLRYSYTVRTSVPAMPYSDSFTPVSRYCITYVGPQESKLTCSSGIEWHKSPLVKAMIKSAVLKGTADSARDLNEVIAKCTNSGGSYLAASRQGSRKSRHRSSSAASSASNSSASSPLLAKTATPVRPKHVRSNSSKVKIALVEPGTNEEKMLLDSECEESEDETAVARASRIAAASVAAVAGHRAMTIPTPKSSTSSSSPSPSAAAALAAVATTAGAAAAAGRMLTAGVGRARRHTVSTAASEGIPSLGDLHGHARVRGHWPTGEPPKFVPVGSKESRTRLLGRPSRSTLVAEKNKKEGEDAAGQGSHGGSQGTGGGLMHRLLYGSSPAASRKSETPAQRQRRMLVRLLAFFLAVSSLMNIWAAWNSKRLLESTWRLQRHEMLLRQNMGATKGGRTHHRHQEMPERPSRTSPEYRNMRVNARAVFLKDLEDQIFSSPMMVEDAQDQLIDAASYKTFMQIKQAFYPWVTPTSSLVPVSPTATASPTLSSGSEEAAATSMVPVAGKNQSTSSSSITTYPWMVPAHRRWAMRLVFQHDRIGILRYDLLTTFERLNRLERQLLETEYMNWIMDERLRCQAWELKKQKRKEAEAQGIEEEEKEGEEEDDQRQQHQQQVSGAAKMGSRGMDPRVMDEFCAGVDRQLKMTFP